MLSRNPYIFMTFGPQPGDDLESPQQRDKRQARENIAFACTDINSILYSPEDWSAQRAGLMVDETMEQIDYPRQIIELLDQVEKDIAATQLDTEDQYLFPILNATIQDMTTAIEMGREAKEHDSPDSNPLFVELAKRSNRTAIEKRLKAIKAQIIGTPENAELEETIKQMRVEQEKREKEHFLECKKDTEEFFQLLGVIASEVNPRQSTITAALQGHAEKRRLMQIGHIQGYSTADKYQALLAAIDLDHIQTMDQIESWEDLGKLANLLLIEHESQSIRRYQLAKDQKHQFETGHAKRTAETIPPSHIFTMHTPPMDLNRINRFFREENTRQMHSVFETSSTPGEVLAWNMPDILTRVKDEIFAVEKAKRSRSINKNAVATADIRKPVPIILRHRQNVGHVYHRADFLRSINNSTEYTPNPTKSFRVQILLFSPQVYDKFGPTMLSLITMHPEI